jgi:glycerophosphoryl diester phosphodiesterase
VKEALQNLLMHLVDSVTAALPQPTPSRDALRRCKLISHRGEHDNRSVLENTLPAFAAARDAGVWGIECDIRWTADLVPVIAHDPDGRRVFGDDAVIGELTFDALRDRLPQVPSLAELVAEFGGHTHLMLEIKAEPYPEPERQTASLAEHLAALVPGEDYHFLALDPDLFRYVDFVPSAACLPVAEFNVSALSRRALERGYGGLTGHYLLLTDGVRRRHETAGQRIGTGHIGSRNALFREINRDVEWIFSNDAVTMQRLLERYASR